MQLDMEFRAVGKTHLAEGGQGVGGDGGVGGEAPTVEFVGGPPHDVPVHAVLRRQHRRRAAAVRGLQALEQRGGQPLRAQRPCGSRICTGMCPCARRGVLLLDVRSMVMWIGCCKHITMLPRRTPPWTVRA